MLPAYTDPQISASKGTAARYALAQSIAWQAGQHALEMFRHRDQWVIKSKGLRGMVNQQPMRAHGTSCVSDGVLGVGFSHRVPVITL